MSLLVDNTPHGDDMTNMKCDMFYNANYDSCLPPPINCWTIRNMVNSIDGKHFLGAYYIRHDIKYFIELETI